jgi:aryl-alcohol dehydrogenase-like predicted oxidoreductase
MRYRPLGNSGLVVSVVGLGCNNFGRRLDVAQTRAVVDAAIDSGVTLLDTADIYGGAGRSEELLGEALAGRRDQVVLATKFGSQPADMGYGPAAGAKGGRAYIRARSSTRCAGSGPTTSTCTRSTRLTRSRRSRRRLPR